jgi:hypothetical protein
VSEDDLKEAAVKRKKFTAKQDEQLHFSYILSKNGKNVLTLDSVTH